MTKVRAKEKVNNAINSAFEHGSEVFIEGREVTNGVFRDY